MKIKIGYVLAGTLLSAVLAVTVIMVEVPRPAGLLSGVPSGATSADNTDVKPAGSRREDSTGSFYPIEPIVGLDPAMVALGERLFHDPRLSRDGTVSCASCHLLARGGDDDRVVSIGVDGRAGVINAPTVFNAAYNFVQMWDGRALTLEEQIDLPLHSAHEMDSNWSQALGKLALDPAYVELFGHLFEDGINRHSVATAIADFERSLITPARFDRFLTGDKTALSPGEQHGYALFVDYGCVACHQGRLVGGNLFQRMGVMADYFALRGGELTEADNGRFNITGKVADRFVFKVPSLRNVALTAPYFHDGSQAQLADAVRIMARVQLGIDMDPQDINSLVAFLQTLTGEDLEGAADVHLQASR